jgi:hypothetical protein
MRINHRHLSLQVSLSLSLRPSRRFLSRMLRTDELSTVCAVAACVPVCLAVYGTGWLAGWLHLNVLVWFQLQVIQSIPC